MNDRDPAMALYFAANSVLGRLTCGECRLAYDEWTYVYELRRALKEFEDAKGIDTSCPF